MWWSQRDLKMVHAATKEISSKLLYLIRDTAKEASSVKVMIYEADNSSNMYSRLRVSSFNHYFCVGYCSLKCGNFIFDFLSAGIEYLLVRDLKCHVTITENSNVHNQGWLVHSFDISADEFAVVINLSQLINLSTHIPDLYNDPIPTFELNLTSVPPIYSNVSILPPPLC